MTPICGEIILPKESIKTQKVTNGTNLITQSEALELEVVEVEKLLTYQSVHSGLTGETRASVTPGERITRNKIKIKSLATSPPRKDPIPDQDKIL